MIEGHEQAAPTTRGNAATRLPWLIFGLWAATPIIASCGSESTDDANCSGKSCASASSVAPDGAASENAESPSGSDSAEGADSTVDTSSGMSGDASTDTDSPPNVDASPGPDDTAADPDMTADAAARSNSAASADGSGPDLDAQQSMSPTDGATGVSPDTTGASDADPSCPELDLQSGCHDDNPCEIPQGAEGRCIPGATTPVTCGGVQQADDCGVDDDCGPGQQCNMDGSDCNAHRVCEPGCTADADCASHERCDGRRCYAIPCNEAGSLECEAGTACTPDADQGTTFTCEPLSCTDASYDCPEGWRCAPDSTSKDEHECERILCNEADAPPCPSNTACAEFSTTYLCRPLRCTTRADCECGVCIDGECYDQPGQCTIAFP